MITIIGAGRIGSTVALLTAQDGLDDIVILNRTKSKAVGEALDIVNTIPEKSLISVTGTDDPSLMKNSDVVVIAVHSGIIKEDRTDVLLFNAPLISEIAKNLRKYADNSKVIVVTNPVDILVYQVLKQTEFPRQRIIGIGSGIDSRRFCFLLGKELGVSQGEIEGLVVGEHGPTMVPLFSHAMLNGENIVLKESKMSEITSELRNYWLYLKSFKGSSVFGAAKNTFDVVKSIMLDLGLHMTSSAVLNGEYGFHDVAMGVPMIMGRNGVDEITSMPISYVELNLLQLSAKRISEGIAKLNL